ncbi:hypothetical protein [Brevibacterium luteolum]|uniref:hypothetical protein n=1 Tax=Brevibacterium luteolum TaxID=199591 RepID=UPI001C25056F|nr:hypothetical protein [Brevibacterium luteolum]
MEQLIIDRSIDINASAHAVFTLISQPGWFINDGELRDHTVTPRRPGVRHRPSPRHLRHPHRRASAPALRGVQVDSR